MTETRVDLLRHGEAAGERRLRGARSDDPLSPCGWAALQRVVERFGPWDAVVSSPLARCREFAESLAPTPAAIDQRLREYDFGRWDGQRLDALWVQQGADLAAFLADPTAVVPPEGEQAAAFCARVRAAWSQLIADHAGERVLVLSHGGVLRQCIADALGAPMTAHARLAWPPAALSRVRVYTDAAGTHTATLEFHAWRAEP